MNLLNKKNIKNKIKFIIISLLINTIFSINTFSSNVIDYTKDNISPINNPLNKDNVSINDNKNQIPISPAKETIYWNPNWEFATFSELHHNPITKYYSISNQRKNLTICINAGHGTVNGDKYFTYCHPDKSAKLISGSTQQGEIKSQSISNGTTLLNGLTEADVTLNISYYIKEALLSLGYDCIMIREDNNSHLDNIARTVYANNNADIHISIHLDSSYNNKGAFCVNVPHIKSFLEMYPVNMHYVEHDKLTTSIINGLMTQNIKLYNNGYYPIDLTQTSFSTIPSVDIEVSDKTFSCTPIDYLNTSLAIIHGINYYYNFE